MNTEMTPQDARPGTTAHGYDTTIADGLDQTLAHERAVDAILDDCFLSIGQGIGLRASLDFEAIVFVRDNFRPKFLAAMRQFGNRWLEDRTTVTAVGWMLGERAVRYADGAASIGLDAIRQASADIERYCQLHAARRTRSRNDGNSEASTARIAGYWCTWDPEP